MSPTANATAAASAVSRLPDGDSFSLFGEIPPDRLPIILKLPDGGQEQVHVPLNGTVNDLKKTISLPRNSNDELRFSFGNSDLDPSASLLDTNIIDAYEHAGSLLHVIGNGVQDINTKVAAVNSVCAVVENISNGIKNMETLCDAATNPKDHLSNEHDNTNSALPSISKDATMPDQTTHWPSATPSALTHSLSRRLPDLFPPEATTAAFPGGVTINNPIHQLGEGLPLEAQPSISSIRDARRRLREATDNSASKSAPEIIPVNDDIGCSTYAHPLPDTFENRDSSVPKENFTYSGAPNVLLAQSGNTTWLGDVMKTWEVNAVRQSGALEKSKDGQDINDYLARLEAEAQEDNSVNDDPSGERQESYEAGDADDNSDEDDGDNDESEPSSAGQLLDAQPNNLNRSRNSMSTVPTTNDVQPSHQALQAIPIAQYQLFTTNASQAVQPAQFHPIVSNSIPLGPRPTASAPEIVAHPGLPSLSSTSSPGISTTSTPIPPDVHMSTPSSASSASAGSGGNLVRRATKIAPAPAAPVQPGTGNGMISMPIFQGCPPITPNWTQLNPVVTGKKKRGRKRKNPQLTEEERALYRKEQNRESARMSRVRRKVIAIEYEDKLKALVDENAYLRKQVDGLNNRLAYLQSILTITVTQRTRT